MSLVLSADVFSPSHWLVMARAMELRIKEIVTKGRIEQESIPEGVLADARNFFVLVQSHIDNSAENILAALNAHIIALHALPHDIASKKAEADKELKKFSELVSTLNDSRELTDAECLAAKCLGQFFSQLAIMGGNVAHIELARGSDWWWGRGGSATYFVTYFHESGIKKMKAVILTKPRRCPNCGNPRSTHQLYNFECPYCIFEFCGMCYLDKSFMGGSEEIILCPHCKRELECKNPFRNMTEEEIYSLEKIAQNTASE